MLLSPHLPLTFPLFSPYFPLFSPYIPLPSPVFPSNVLLVRDECGKGKREESDEKSESRIEGKEGDSECRKGKAGIVKGGVRGKSR